MKRVKDTETFFKKAMNIHSNKYDYSKVDYVDKNTKVCIICPEHGEFWQTPRGHLRGYGCRKCSGNIRSEKLKFGTEEWIKKAKEVHGDKYDYSKVEYKNNYTKVCIICPEHGEFWQTPSKHLQGRGCPKCANNIKLSTEEFIQRAKNVHRNKYDYSKVEYNGIEKPVCIICPEHGEFWQTPQHHILGYKCGCPKCSMSKLEQFVIDILNNKKIEYIHECSKKDLFWLGKQRLDVYIPEMKLCIECQGIQHFRPESFSGNDDKNINLKKNVENDVKKFIKCTENGIKIIYVVDNKKDVIDNAIYRYNNVYNKNEFIKFIENET